MKTQEMKIKLNSTFTVIWIIWAVFTTIIEIAIKEDLRLIFLNLTLGGFLIVEFVALLGVGVSGTLSAHIWHIMKERRYALYGMVLFFCIYVSVLMLELFNFDLFIMSQDILALIRRISFILAFLSWIIPHFFYFGRFG